MNRDVVLIISAVIVILNAPLIIALMGAWWEFLLIKTNDILNTLKGKGGK